MAFQQDTSGQGYSPDPSSHGQKGLESRLVLTVLEVEHGIKSEEVGHCMLPYIRDQILELVNETLLVAVL